MITKNKTWIEKSTGDEVLVTWVSDELVSYSKKEDVKVVRTVRQFMFLQDFISKELLADEREMRLMDWVDLRGLE